MLKAIVISFSSTVLLQGEKLRFILHLIVKTVYGSLYFNYYKQTTLQDFNYFKDFGAIFFNEGWNHTDGIFQEHCKFLAQSKCCVKEC